MGDMADFALDQVEYYEDRRHAYRIGEISDAEAYEEGILDELGYEIGSGQRSITCYCCQQSGLHWEKLKGKWRLFDGNSLHNCPVKPLK